MSDVAFWKVVVPDIWPEPPKQWSYSSSREIAACPRRWALRNADYMESVGVTPYPERLRPRTVAGQVTHLALQRVAEILHSAGCTSPQDPKVVGALRSAGGLSGVLEACSEEMISHHREDPRATPYLNDLQIELVRRLPTLRQTVQGSLQRIFGTSRKSVESIASNRQEAARALGPGFHPEVKLEPPDLPWVGWADAIKLGPEVCEIIDYKTGNEDPAHADQLRLYALLWARDHQLNPKARLATHLTIVYPGVSQSIEPPDETALARLEAGLLDLTADGASVLRRMPPPASVSAETCRFCDVKQLCSDYWEAGTRSRLHENEQVPVRSLEIQVGVRLGLRSWSARIEFDPWFQQGREAVLVGSAIVELQPGSWLRIIDGRVESSDEGPVHVYLEPRTEVFLLETQSN